LGEKKCRQCGKNVAVNDSYKVKRHFQSLHPEIVEILIAQLKRKEESQTKLPVVASTKQKVLESELVSLFSSAPIAMALITNSHFQVKLVFLFYKMISVFLEDFAFYS
jgi:hypothetical protein